METKTTFIKLYMLQVQVNLLTAFYEYNNKYNIYAVDYIKKIISILIFLNSFRHLVHFKYKRTYC